MNTILIVHGKEQCVLDLADNRLAGSILQRIAIGDETMNGSVSESNAVIVELPDTADDAIGHAEEWIRAHLVPLSECSATKTIEFQTFLEPDIGSRILTVPNSFVKLCADSGLGIANQSFNVIPNQE
ncbi:MAG: hypothetical protein AAGA30_05950 [Planctomycetota bacterium]